MARPVIMDCDPGNDDAVALLYAMAHPEHFNILGITTINGNVSLEQINKNALKICELGGRSDIPIYSGCKRPLVRQVIIRDHAHGECGMEGSSMPEPKAKIQEKSAVDFIIETLMNSKEKVTLLPTGPLTNIAVAMIIEPQIIEKIDEIILMGGAIAAGNVTPYAEFNMYSDPHAGSVVFSSGAKITMIGLDVTHKITVDKERAARFRALDNEPGRQIAAMMEASMDFDQSKFGLSGRAIHDPCVPIFMIHPELFSGRNASVVVDIWHEPQWGATNVSFYPRHVDPANAFVLEDVDVDGVFAELYASIGTY